MKKFLNEVNGEEWTPMEIETARSDACNMIWDISYGGGCVSIYRLRNRVCVSVIKDVRDASKVKTAHAEPTGGR